FDLDGAGAGVCIIWYIRYEDGLAGKETGNNLSDLSGCFDLSNGINVYREVADGGTVALANGGTDLASCVGDIVFDVTHTTTAPNLSYWYIITDDNDNILGFQNSADGNTLDLSGAPAGVCRIWGWSSKGEPTPVMGENISTLSDGDCESISSNFITVDRIAGMVEGGTISTMDDTVICVDGNPDPIDVTVMGSMGTNGGWIITDDANNILALPPSPPFDLDGAGAGVCIIWYIRYEDGLAGKDTGNNLSDLSGCFDLSNGINVYREVADGGTVTLTDGGTDLASCVGDIVFDVTHITTAPNLSYWYIITDDNDNILGFQNSADGNTLDLSGAPAGVCRIWGWSFKGEPAPIMGENISTLTDGDCESISSNFITVDRIEGMVEGGTISTEDDTVICVDGNPDPIDVTVMGSTGTNGGWIITDDANNILALPPSPPFDLDGAGAGVCIIWYIRYEDGLAGKETGNNLSDLSGCFDLSNGITVYREVADGGTVTLADGGTDLASCVGDIVFDVTHSTSAPNLSYWYIITDDNDDILGFQNSADGNTLDLSGAPAGVCRIWGWSFKGEPAPVMGENISTLTDGDCESISSNFITVDRIAGMVEGGTISTIDDTVICVDGNPDPIDVTVMGSTGTNSGWIITDDANNILALPPSPPFDLDGAGAGVCIIWYIRYEDGLAGKETGNNLSDLSGCFDLSNGINVYREVADGGTVALADGGTDLASCVGDIVFDVTHTTTAPNLSYWYIITDDNDNILGFQNSADGNTLDLSGAPVGVCRIWGWSSKGEPAPIMGENISTLSDGDCESISSNFITVYREIADGGTVALTDSSTSFANCVGNIVFDVIHTTTAPNLSYWYIITDDNDNILGFQNSTEGNTLDLSGAPEGVCRIWGWSSKGEPAPVMGENISTLSGGDCESISSNFITVYREIPDGGTVSSNMGMEVEICVDGTPDPIIVSHTTTAPNLSYWYIITDETDEILAFTTDTIIDLDGAGVGVCRIWGWNYRGLPDPVVGENISSLMDDDCEDVSDNFIEVDRREDGSACIITSITELQSVDRLNIYPNPANNYIQIEYEGLVNAFGQLQLTDLTGRTLLNVELEQANDRRELDITNVPEGVYFVRINSERQTTSQKIIIMK
ncbi:MAG: T9SS type A sorting domain-containing protein, partial [Bacteroidota bacterium]